MVISTQTVVSQPRCHAPITPICFYSFRFCGVTAPRVSLEDLHNDVHQYQVTLYLVIIGELECAVFRYCTPARGGPCWAVLGRALLQIKNKIVGDYNQLAAGFRGTRVTGQPPWRGVLADHRSQYRVMLRTDKHIYDVCRCRDIWISCLCQVLGRASAG